MASRIEGLEKMKARAMALPEAARDQLKKANDRNASEFLAKVESIIPNTGDGKGGDLKATLKKEETETGFTVSVGGPDAPYPLHLEAGHMGPDGKPVAGKPFWNPAKRVLRKRARGRSGRAMRAAVKIALAEGGS